MISIIRKSFSILTAALIVFSLFSIVVAIEQSTASASTPESYFESPPGSDWGTLYSDYAPENATAFSAAEVSGSYVVAGTQTGPMGPELDSWAVLVKLDGTGTVIDNANFNVGNDHNAAYDIIGVADGYVVAGTKHQGADPPYDPYIWLVKTNTTLDTQWQQTYGTAYPDRGNSVIEDDTGFVIGGFQGDGGTGDGWLIHTNSTGTKDWDVVGGWLTKEVYSVVQTSDNGYILGTDNGIKKTTAASSPPSESWTAVTGNPYYSVQQTTDGGYIGVGTTNAPDGTTDIILTKLSSSGVEEWGYTYSSDSLVPDIELEPSELPYDYGRHVVQTADGGYAVVGQTETIEHDDTMFYGSGGHDLWLLKVNASGVLQWDLALGGDDDDSGQHIIETSDNDLLVSGSATVGGVKKMWVVKVHGDFTPPTPSFTYTPDSPVFVGQQVRFNAAASTDADGTITTYEWDFGDGNSGTGVTADHTYRSPGTYTATLAVTDNDGTTRSVSDDITVAELGTAWERVIDGSEPNAGLSIVEAHDGGYVIAGYTINGASGGSAPDGWLLKVNDDSTIAWERKFADYENSVPTNIQALESVAQTADGGYIMTGKTHLGTHSDLWLIKTAGDGTPDWYKTFGGSYNDEGHAVAQTSDGGYIITGFTSTAVDSNTHSVWLIKTNGSGVEIWNQTFDDADDDYRGYAVAQTFDGGYVIATDGSGNGTDIDLIKTNDTGVAQWTHTWDGTSPYAGGRWIAETADRGFVVVGTWNGSTMLGKVNVSGAEQWAYTYDDGTNAAYGQHAAQTPNGGYIIAGYSLPVKDDCYLVKTDASGNKEWEKKFGTTAEYEEGSGVLALSDGSYIAMYNRSTTGDTDLCIRRYGNTGVFSTSGAVTVTEWSVTEDPGLDPVTYDPSGAPAGVDLDNARGFEITATGADDTYSFRINFTTPIDSDFTLYKLPSWTVVPYTVIDEYTIEVSLTVTGGVLDPPFMFVPNTAPSQPVNTAPADEAADVSTTPTLSSSAFSDVDASDTHTASQWLITTTSGSYGSPLYDSGTDMSNKTSIVIPASTLETNTTYYFKVRHQDDKDDWSDWSFETSFTTLNTAPDQPVNSAPANAATDVTLTPTLTSSAFADSDAGDTHAASQWQISTTSGDYSSVVYDSAADSTNKTSVAIPASTLTYSTTFYFRVQHQDNRGTWSDWSAETSFTTTSEPNTAPAQPTNVEPEDEATGVLVIPTLESSAFSDSDTGDTHAASQWQITSATGNYSSAVYDSGTDTTNKTAVTIPAATLSDGTTYYFRVRHQDNHSEWSSWSTETSFTTISIGSSCGCSSTAASATDIASGWGLVGFLGISGVYTSRRWKKHK
ncbi:PKD domain-containing protein [Chloroflexota bacterium]